jgi:hypothetical protein
LWLLDPEVESVERIGRGYAAQLRSLEDMRKFQSDAGMTGEAANAPGLHGRLFAAARAAGYVKRNRKGQETLTVGVPSMVDLVPARITAPRAPMLWTPRGRRR